ncbi:hypothetical protein A2U01_0014483 [Trifolium medium]|uniref:Uncharacterized protein n=1 Tax=Trifolium medium TaxID=97028 RepID=A0A392N1C7_9FABA|nr:hypothetical protein [Trifolium medium]
MMNSTNKGNTTLTDTDEAKPSIQNLNNPIAANMHFEIKKIGILFDCDFYIPDEGDHTGIAFRLAYYKVTSAKWSLSNRALCVYVGSMLCSVVPGFRTSVEKSLNEIGIRPRFVSLPSQAKENKVEITYASQLDWSSILVIFGYCILILFNHDDFKNDAVGYKNYISNCIVGLKAKFRWDPSNQLNIPFDSTKVNIISTMLGSDDLRATVKKFLMSNSNHSDSQVGNVCKYLSDVLS